MEMEMEMGMRVAGGDENGAKGEKRDGNEIGQWRLLLSE